jgi:hypothetical protein
MSTPSPHSEGPASSSKKKPVRLWLKRYLPALLYGWFWFGMLLSALVAPQDRVDGLESSLVTEGWHLSMMAGLFGGVILLVYWLRVSGRWK